jgi:hypothetical protein
MPPFVCYLARAIALWPVMLRHANPGSPGSSPIQIAPAMRSAIILPRRKLRFRFNAEAHSE